MNVVYSMGKYSHYFVIALKRISPVKILNIIHLKLIKYCKTTVLQPINQSALLPLDTYGCPLTQTCPIPSLLQSNLYHCVQYLIFFCHLSYISKKKTSYTFKIMLIISHITFAIAS